MLQKQTFVLSLFIVFIFWVGSLLFHLSERPTFVVWFHFVIFLPYYRHIWYAIYPKKRSSFLFISGFWSCFSCCKGVAAAPGAAPQSNLACKESSSLVAVANVVDRGSRDVGLGRWSTGLGRGAGEIRAIGEERVKRRKGRNGWKGDVFLIKYERKEEGSFNPYSMWDIILNICRYLTRKNLGNFLSSPGPAMPVVHLSLRPRGWQAAQPRAPPGSLAHGVPS